MDKQIINALLEALINKADDSESTSILKLMSSKEEMPEMEEEKMGADEMIECGEDEEDDDIDVKSIMKLFS